MTRRPFLYLLLALVIATAGPGSAAALPPAPGLILVTLATPQEADLIAAADLPIYAHFDGATAAYALAGGGAEQVTALAAEGLGARLLEPTTAGATYYLAFPTPGRGQPDWDAFGRVLFRDPQVVVLRATEAGAEGLAAAGVQVALVTLDPKPTSAHAPAAFPPVTTPDPLIQSMVAQVDSGIITQYTKDLSGEWPVIIDGAPYTLTTRNTYSGVPITKATHYVRDHLAGLGLTVEEHVWQANRPPNVIGELTGETEPGKIFMITGHLDDMPSSGLAPGADDNASGSVAVMVAADILTQYRWGCTLRFAFWTGEEQGLWGSKGYAQRAAGRNENIAGVLNLDMIGWNTPGSPADIDLHAKSTLPASVELANQFASVVNAYAIGLIPQVVPNGTSSSDHSSFWQYGYTAILGIEDYYGIGDFNPYYHTSNDKFQHLDLGYYTEFVKASVATFAHMSDCLLTGTLAGDVTAAHDGSAISGAAIELTGDDLSYAATTDAGGHYSQRVPAGAYDIAVSADGYLPATGTVDVPPGIPVTRDFTLAAAPPVAPAVTIDPLGGVTLVWHHTPPNAAYRVHRAAEPYFTPGDATLQAVLTPPFADPLTYHDGASGAGDPALNHFYVVLGLNLAGESAMGNRVGEFDFALTPGE